MAQLFVTLGHNQINKLIRIAPCLSIDFSDGAGIVRMTPALILVKENISVGIGVNLYADDRMAVDG